MQGIRGQPGGGELGVESVVGKGDSHEMKDWTHCRTGAILVKGDGFPFSAFSSITETLVREDYSRRIPLAFALIQQDGDLQNQ